MRVPLPSPSRGRLKLRWSTEGHAAVAVSIAALPAESAMVAVGPPLLASGASNGFATRKPAQRPTGHCRLLLPLIAQAAPAGLTLSTRITLKAWTAPPPEIDPC